MNVSGTISAFAVAMLLAPSVAGAAVVKAIEYVGDHVFLTARPAEIAALDSGQIPGWIRTGVELLVHDTPEDGLVPVCRFYSAAFAPRSAHFHTAFADECVALKARSSWIDEGVAFYASLPSPGGLCPLGDVPVHRFYNDGRGGAPAHKFTPYRSGGLPFFDGWGGILPVSHLPWTPEGVGPFGIAFCTEWVPFYANAHARYLQPLVELLGKDLWEFAWGTGKRVVDFASIAATGPWVDWSSDAGVLGITLSLTVEGGIETYETFVIAFVGQDRLEGCRRVNRNFEWLPDCEPIIGRRL